MSFSPISYISQQYEDFENYWLKCYKQGTVTPITMYNDAAGTTSFAKLQINESGFFESSGGAIIIPHVGETYDAYLFPTEAEADSNTVTVNSPQIADNISASEELSASAKLNPLTVSAMINDASFSSADVGISVPKTKEFSSGNGGGGVYDVILTGVTPGVDLPNTFNIIVSVANPLISFSLRIEGENNIDQFGPASDGVTNDSAVFQLAGEVAKVVVTGGPYANVTIDNISDLKIRFAGGSFVSAAGSNSPALHIKNSGVELEGHIVADGNKANNTNSFTDSDLGSLTSTLSIEDCNGNINGNLKAVNSFHDGVCLEGNTNLTINGDIISKGSKNRLALATGGMTGLKHSGNIILSDNDNAGAHGIRIGSLLADPFTSQNKFGDVYTNNVMGISVLMENREANNTFGDIIAVNGDSAAIKIEDNDGSKVGDIRVLNTGTFEGVIINSARQVQIGDIYIVGASSDGLFIDSATGIGTNCEDVTIGDVFVQGSNGDGIAIRSSLSAGATKNISLGKVNVTDCQDNGLRVYDTVDGCAINGGILRDNNQSAGGFVDFRVDPGVTSVQWGSIVYDVGSGQVGDNGINPYKESGLNVKAYVTYTAVASVVTVLDQRGVTATPTNPATGDVFIVWDSVIADDDPVTTSSNDLVDSGIFSTTASGNRSRVRTYTRGSSTLADNTKPITVFLME